MTHLWALPAISLSLVGLGQQVEDQAVAPSLTNPATEILELEEERYKRLTIPVTIGGTGPYDFMIDTGSQATAVTHGINQNHAFPTLGTATLVGMASRRPVEVVEVNDLMVGSHQINDLVAPVLHKAHVGADGIIAPLLDLCGIPTDLQAKLPPVPPANTRLPHDVLLALLDANRAYPDRTDRKAAKQAILSQKATP